MRLSHRCFLPIINNFKRYTISFQRQCHPQSQLFDATINHEIRLFFRKAVGIKEFGEKAPLPKLPESLNLPPAPSNSGGVAKPKSVDQSPIVSPRASPRWGAELPPVLNLTELSDDPLNESSQEQQAVSTEEADVAASNAVEDKPVSADLLAMSHAVSKRLPSFVILVYLIVSFAKGTKSCY